MSVQAYLGLGSNLGDREAVIVAALERLDRTEGVFLRATVPPVETDPVGPPQPKYLNTVAQVETALPAAALLACCHAIEKDLGRERSSEVRWGPRTIDIDLLLYGSEMIDEPGLCVPHPRMHERAFVLEPLARLAPDVRHPTTGLTAEEMWRQVSGD